MMIAKYKITALFFLCLVSFCHSQWFDEYKDLDQINARADQFAANYPSLVSPSVVGQSHEGRDIRVLKIAGENGTRDVKPAVFINSTTHAREWISPMAGMYITEQLLTGYGSDPTITNLLDQVDVYFMPVVNPDGYAYSWEEDDSAHRLWRKNRRPNDTGQAGVDLNRNFDFAFGGPGSSGFDGSEIFRGAEPFSEPESRAVRDFYHNHPNIVGNLDVHSFGQFVLGPYGHSHTEIAPDAAMIDRLGEEMALAMVFTNLQYYRYQRASDLALASGLQADWAYDAESVYSYTLELRPNSGFPGFELPEDEILGASEEAFAAVLEMLRFTAEISGGDFNYDGELNCADLNALTSDFEASPGVIGHEAKFEFDVSGDGALSPLDIRTWLDAGGFSSADGNLDGVVDSEDLRVWTRHQGNSTYSVCHGDFNTDGVVDQLDFEVWEAAAVPEPSGWVLMLVGLVCISRRRS